MEIDDVDSPFFSFVNHPLEMLRLKVEENLSKYNLAQPRTRVSGAILYILEYFKIHFFQRRREQQELNQGVLLS